MISYGEGMDGGGVIAEFEPGRHLRIEHVPVEGVEGPELAPGPLVTEYLIETDGGTTVLRLVSSGIPNTPEWDWFYDGTDRGWPGFLIGLRHYLEHHAGTPRDHVVSMTGFAGSLDDAWAKLASEEGLGLGTAGADGDRYETVTSFGQSLTGEVLLSDPPFRFLATVEELNDAMLKVGVEQFGPTNMLYLSLSTFGLDADRVAELRQQWSDFGSAFMAGSGDVAEAFENAVDTALAGDSPNA